MIHEHHGDLLKADAEALVNTVNTAGIMGKGIALQFKRAFPENFKAYKRACDLGEVALGQMFIWDGGAFGDDGPRFIINFPTKKHWRSNSNLADIKAGLVDLVEQVQRLGIRSIAVPPLGCGHGGLRWEDVRPVIVEAFEAVPDVDVFLFPPEGAPAAAEQVVRTEAPRMSPGRAAMICVMERYLPFAVDITAVDIQKLMYFMQEAGEPLKLRYVRGRYGPYADNLRHVLVAMEWHYIRGTGDGSSKALTTIPFEILDGASEQAHAFLKGQPATRARLERVIELVEGFETTYGLELLATVHWAATRSQTDESRLARPTPDEEVDSVVRSWNVRKGRLFSPEHVTTALVHLRKQGWLDPPANPDGRLIALPD